MDQELDVTNAEIIEYLNITLDVLKSAKSSLDLNRLKTIIDILKRDEKKTYGAQAKKAGIRYEKIIDILEKRNSGLELTKDEIKTYEEFKNNPFFDLAQGRNYQQLYELLNSNERSMTAGELSVLYFCLYKERTRQKKKPDILKGIYTYITQNVYFDNMDSKYKKAVHEDKK